MRFFCRFKGEEAEQIKKLFKEIGVGEGDGPSIRQFTKAAVTREIKALSEAYRKHLQSQAGTEKVATDEETKDEATS